MLCCKWKSTVLGMLCNYSACGLFNCYDECICHCEISKIGNYINEILNIEINLF